MILSEAPFQPRSQGQIHSKGMGKMGGRVLVHDGKGPLGPMCAYDRGKKELEAEK